MGTKVGDKRVPVLVAALLCALAWSVGEITREPWPFPIFPSFGTIRSDADLTNEARKLFVFHGSEESSRVELDELFDEPVRAFYAPMTDSFTAIEDEGSVEFGQWVNERARQKLGWSQCVQAVELVQVSAKNEEAERLLRRVEFSECP